MMLKRVDGQNGLVDLDGLVGFHVIDTAFGFAGAGFLETTFTIYANAQSWFQFHLYIHLIVPLSSPQRDSIDKDGSPSKALPFSLTFTSPFKKEESLTLPSSPTSNVPTTVPS